MPVERQADRVARASALGERHVHHPRPAELLEKILGHLECTAVRCDVLAENKGFGAFNEDLAQRPVERLRHGQGFGRRTFRRRIGRNRRHPGLRRNFLRKQVPCHARRIGARLGERNLEAVLHEARDLSLQRIELRALGGGKASAQFRQRIFRKKRLGFSRLEVVARVVGGVPAQAKGARLDQHGPAGLPHPVDGGGDCPEVDLDIGGTVEHLTLDPVARGAPPKLGACGILFAGRRGIGVAVVFDDKEDRQTQQGGEIQRLMHISRAAHPVADEREAHGRPPEAALRIGRACHSRYHGAKVADHGYRAVSRIAVVDVALASLGRARSVGEVLVQVLNQVTAPDEMSPKIAMGETNHVDILVRQQGQRHNEALVALPAGHGPSNQALSEQIQNAVVRRAGRKHPRVRAQQGVGKVGIEIRGPQIAPVQDRGGFWINHAGLNGGNEPGRVQAPLLFSSDDGNFARREFTQRDSMVR